MENFKLTIISISIFAFIYTVFGGIGILIAQIPSVDYNYGRVIYFFLLFAAVFVAYYTIARIFVFEKRAEILKISVVVIVLFFICLDLLIAEKINIGAFLLKSVFSIIVHVFAAYVGFKLAPYTTPPADEKNGEVTLVEEAQIAYTRRDYQKAYNLFCAAEASGPLDDSSIKFRELAKKRLENA